MDAELAVLASSAATTIVGLMATDAWDQVKEKIAGLWMRFRPDQAEAVERDLERACAEITGAGQAGATVFRANTLEWESRLLRLLAADAAAAAELRRVAGELGQIQAGRQARGQVRQHAKVSGHGTVIQIGGDGTVGGLALTGRHLNREPGR